MKSKELYGLLLSLVLLLTACSSDVDNTPLQDVQTGDDVIVISGGRPSLGAATRTVTPPALPGICQADRMKIWVYYKDKYAWGDPSDLTYKENMELTVSNTNRAPNGSVDRWAKQKYTYTSDAATGNHFAMPALAYTSTDAAKFEVSTGSNYTLMSLQLTAAALAASPMVTPELFFGRTKFTHPVNPSGSYFDNGKWLDEGRNYYYQYGLSSRTYTDVPISGHLYRIVSQINVNMTDVPTEVVDHLELYMTNVPKQLGLYGTHGNVYGSDDIGRFYPVTAVTTISGCIDSNTLVATTNDFTGDEAHMSLFLLPSEVGGELTLRVHYKPGAVKDNMGNDVLQRDYVIQPGKSALMTGDDADVYSVSDASLRSGSDLYVYNSTNHKFYSYANVRVNINGKYENVAAEEQDVDINLEVEPGYEREHSITIK